MKIQNKISMIQPVTIGWIMAFVYLCYGCSSHAQESNNLKAAKVRFSLPLMINGQLVNQADSFTIFLLPRCCCNTQYSKEQLFQIKI
jgi:hypothetical protein